MRPRSRAPLAQTTGVLGEKQSTSEDCNVTVAGESAGGASACAHLISPKSAGLFHRAIIQSAPCLRAKTSAELLAQSQNEFGPVIGGLDKYGEPGTSRAGLAMQSVMTDHLWASPATETNRLLAARVPTYAYEFADRWAPWVSSTPVVPSFPTGAFHASELQYLFEADYFAGRTLSPAQSRLSDTMIGYWSRFAHHGDPNGTATPPWPAVRAGQDDVQRLAPGVSGIRPENLCREHKCRFWQSLDG